MPHRRILRTLCWTALCVPSASALALPIVVNDIGDQTNNCTTTCTLRGAVSRTLSGDTISFDVPDQSTIVLTNGSIGIPTDISITGPGPTHLTIKGNGTQRLFVIGGGPSSTQSISGLTLEGGVSVGMDGSAGTLLPGGPGTVAGGGCVYINAGASVRMDQVDMRDCSATGGKGGDGGLTGSAGGVGGAAFGAAIYVSGGLTLSNSDVINAIAIGGDGGSAVGQNSSGIGGNGGNAGSAAGGAFYVQGSGYLSLFNVTLIGPTANGGRGGAGANGALVGGNGGNGGDSGAGAIEVGAGGGKETASVGFTTILYGGAFGGIPGKRGTGGLANGSTGAVGAYGASAIDAQSVITVNDNIFLTLGGDLCTGTGLMAFDKNISNEPTPTCAGFTSVTARIFSDDVITRAYSDPFPGLIPMHGSAPIDATACPVSIFGLFDQHGTPRPQGPLCDLGAIEADYVFVNGFDPF